MKYFLVFVFFSVLIGVSSGNLDDKPCQARTINNRSTVCVCTATYCDEITRETVPSGSFMQYTSSEGGSRFKKTSSQFQNYIQLPDEYSLPTLELNPRTTYQTIEGFGGAITDAAGINWQSLGNPQLKQNFINTYFGDKGIEYNMMRVPIGGSDFSTHAYAYNEYPVNDTNLSNFTLAYEDYAYKLPMIKAAFAAATSQIDIVATTWSPSTWMKSNDAYSGRSRLLKEYFQTYALYHKRFIDSYKAEGIPIWAVTTTNEPLDGVITLPRINTLGWSTGDMAKWIVNNLGPTLKGSNVKILAVDDQRFMIPVYFNSLVIENKEALQYIDGVAVHYYADDYTPPALLVETMKDYPDKFVISTEACEGAFPWEQPKVDLGSWDRAEHYAKDILEVLNHNVVGWIDWNVCLDKQGGPNWAQNFVDSPVIVFPENGEFVKQPMFYILGHFSKFIPRGSVRIQATDTICPTSVWNAAFKTPRNTIVVVLYNKEKESNGVRLKIGSKQAIIHLEPRSITTIEFENDY